MSLPNSQVPSRFRFYVDNELKKERMGNEIERVYGRTNHGQLFCFITSEKSRYAVRLIIYEEYQHLRIQRERGVHRLRKKEYFTTREDASNFVKEKVRKYSNGELDIFAFRVRLVPMEVHKNPDRYLEPGDHIQRDMLGGFGYSHDGVYLGNGMVAHYTNILINNPGSSFAFSSNVSSSSSAKSSNASIVPFNKFVLSQEQEVRIVVHCFRRRTPFEICRKAREVIAGNYRRDGYHLLKNNCQHFATLCVTGKEFLTDRLFSYSLL